MRLIDADELKKKFGYTDEWYKSRTVAQKIDNAPTVDMNTKLSVAYLKGRRQGQSEERQTAEWKHNNFDEHYCNKCGNFALWSEEADGYYEVQSNFCPNCGADMRKGGAE